jgi:hypothetical protein
MLLAQSHVTQMTVCKTANSARSVMERNAEREHSEVVCSHLCLSRRLCSHECKTGSPTPSCSSSRHALSLPGGAWFACLCLVRVLVLGLHVCAWCASSDPILHQQHTCRIPPQSSTAHAFVSASSRQPLYLTPRATSDASNCTSMQDCVG